MTRFRKFCCRWFSTHDPVFTTNVDSYEIHECKWCGLYAAIEHDTRHTIILGWR